MRWKCVCEKASMSVNATGRSESYNTYQLHPRFDEVSELSEADERACGRSVSTGFAAGGGSDAIRLARSLSSSSAAFLKKYQILNQVLSSEQRVYLVRTELGCAWWSARFLAPVGVAFRAAHRDHADDWRVPVRGKLCADVFQAPSISTVRREI